MKTVKTKKSIKNPLNLNKQKHSLSLLVCSLFLFVILSACGKSKSSVSTNSTNSSRITDSSIITANTLVADCSGGTQSSLGLDVQLSSYYNPGTNIIQPNIIKMKLSQVPSGLTTSENVYLQFFRWYEDVPGQRVLNANPVKFYFQSKINGSFLNSSDPQDRISKAVIQNMIIAAKNNGIGDGLSVSNFLDNHLIILTEMDLQYDALSISVYNTTQGTAAQGWLDVLIPQFVSNPNTYAATHAASSLQQIHPNWAQRALNWSEQDYYNQTEKFCQKFL